MYFKYDLKNGIVYDSVKFIVPVIIAIISFFSFLSEVESVQAYGFLDRVAEFPDMLMYLFKAEKPFNPNDTESFKFPFGWLITQLFIAFVVGKYPFSELYDNHGANVLIKGGSRSKWIVSKFLWTLTVCVLYYAIIVLTIAVLCLIYNIPFTVILRPSDSLLFVTSTDEILGLDFLKILLLPLLTSIAFSTVQLLISLITQPVYGFAFVLGFCGISIFTNTIVSFGNCSMLIRNESFLYSDIETNKSILLLSAIIVASFISCIVIFKRCDIIRNRKEE